MLTQRQVTPVQVLLFLGEQGGRSIAHAVGFVDRELEATHPKEIS